MLPILFLFSFSIISLAECIEDKSGYFSDDNLFSFGQNKVLKDTSSKLENSVLKSKVDALGEILKKKVDVLKNAEKSRPLELVFLVDASSSVGAENFESELKFVKKFLADFTISNNQTRVAIISFASPNEVIRHVDLLSVTDTSLNKCSLMNKNITYSGGGTYTLGAMTEAKELFSYSRSGAYCALFLVTDGFSNGGDPRPVAKELRAAGVTVFTFGISTGNRAELYDMSSVPNHEHSFLLDSFAEFEALARRALHEDLAIGYYVTVEDQSLCKPKCSPEASCTCGLRTGHYSCLCPPGFYGSGLLNSRKPPCTMCPNGTYHDGSVPGDVTVCIPCPDVNHMTYNPAGSKKDCFCKQGFKPTKNGSKCEMIHCPDLDVPENGYMVQGWCSTVMNAGCGIRCNVGYSLVGSSVRLCLPNETWSGIPPKCIMKRCLRFRPPQNGNLSCTDDEGEKDLPLDAECRGSCKEGFALIGSSKRTCLPITKWDGIPNKCRIIHCRALPEITNGYYDNENCTKVKTHDFGTICKINCNPGYELNGPDIRKCVGKGTWTNKREITICTDNMPPTLICPDNITVTTKPEEGYGWASWKEPVPEDNSNQSVIIWTLPVTEQPMKLGIGKTIIIYVATDSSFNQASCNFTIEVVDGEPPVVTNCDSNESYIVLSSERSDMKWLEPEFIDNSGESVKITTSHKLEELPLGSTNVTYMGSDSSGNNSSCTLLVTVIEDSCERPSDPTNGSLNCTDEIDNIGSVTCSVMCDKGFSLTTEDSEFKYYCDTNLTFTEDYDSASSVVPQCSEIDIPNSVVREGAVSFETNSPDWCNSSDLMNEVTNTVQNHLETVCFNSSCKINKNVNVECESVVSSLEEESNKILGRRRREAPKTRVNIKFALEERKIKDYNQENADQENLLLWFSQDKTLSKSGLFPTKNLNLKWENEWPVCFPGYITKKQLCVKCPAGTAWNVGNRCVPCPLGWYQPKAGEKECIKCPDHTSTRKTNARSIRACKAICPPGTYSRNRKGKGHAWKIGDVGVIPCVSCPVATYQPSSGSTTCLTCESNLTTKNRGSTSRDKCIMSSDMYCKNVSCHNGGVCKIYKGKLLCLCPTHFLGSFCETKLDLCLSKPCLHGGTCHTTDSGYNCTCPVGFMGKNCQEEIDECTSNPCKNSGECVDLIGEFHCHCPPMFYGMFCEFKLDECETEPCAQGAKCVNFPNEGYSCECGDGYYGRQCEISPCEMRPNICPNNGTCHSSFNDTHQFYWCECDKNWTGRFCDIFINPCDSTPCKHSGTCLFIPQSGNFSCLCQPGFYGTTCETYISPDFALHFPSPSTSNYVKVKSSMSSLFEFSLCMWVQSSFTRNYGTLFSYATAYHDNTITLTDYNGLVLYINGERVITDIRVNDGIWHSVCIDWQAYNGLWDIYIDSYLEATGSGLSNNSYIPGHGLIIIGQDQDRIGGGFNPVEALVGNIAGVDLWSYKINALGSKNHAEDCNNFNNNTLIGNVLSWGQLRDALHGTVEIKVSPLCKGCSSPFTPQYSTLKLINSGSVAVYTCNEGYVFDQRGKNILEQRRKCLKDGTWQGNVPVCLRCYCGYPGYFPYGKVKGNSYFYMDKISYECNSGFKLVGSEERQCLANGTWSGVHPSCQAGNCPSIEVPKYSNMWVVVGDSYHMEFECIGGYLISGSALLTCLNNRTWDSDPPVCNPIYCRQPHEFGNFEPAVGPDSFNNNFVTNYPIGSTVKYMCQPRFTPSTNDSMVIGTCNRNGQWELSKQNVECNKIPACAPLLEIEHGSIVTSSKLFNVGTQVNISCDIGYKLNGNSSKVCLSSALWSGEKVVCEEISCQSLRKMKNLTTDIVFNETNTAFGSTAIMKCVQGSQLIVNNQTLEFVSWTCSNDELWEGDFNLSDISVSCFRLKTECSQPKVPSHGFISQLSSEVNSYPVGSTLKIQCHQGYEVNGTDEMECQQNGSWSYVNNSVCQAVECPNPYQPPNTELASLPSLEYGSIALHKCKPGYQSVGIFAVVCQANKKWSRFKGKCIRLSCGKPDVHPEATIAGNSYLFQDHVKIICPTGTTIKGEPILTCQVNGTWSALPKCV